jgi:hypothetical protein
MDGILRCSDLAHQLRRVVEAVAVVEVLPKKANPGKPGDAKLSGLRDDESYDSGAAGRTAVVSVACFRIVFLTARLAKEHTMQTRCSKNNTPSLTAGILLAAGAVAFSSATLAAGLYANAGEARGLTMLLSGAPATDKTTMTTRAAKAAPHDASIARQRAVAVNPDALTASVKPTQIGIELFDGQVVAANVELFEQRSPTNYTLHGAIPGSDKSQVVLTVVDGKIAGTVTLVDEATAVNRTYLLVPNADASYSLREINPAGLPEDHPAQPLVAPTTQHKANTKAAAADTPDSGGTVDVMVVYSQQTAAATGSAINAQIQQVIDGANVVYANSGITMRLRLVRAEAVPYSESGNFNTDLNTLTAGTGGLSGVPALRNTYAADIVSMFVEGMQYCGLGWIGPSVGYAFNVVNRGCALSNLSFVHEVGHNFGALHEPAADPSIVPYAYGHGYSYPPGRWRDVMSIGTDCVAVTGCGRIGFFSNPNLTFGLPATPLGNTSASDVARVHNQNAYPVANFRNSGSGGGCSFAVPGGADVAAAGLTGTFAVTGTPACAWNASSDVAWLQVVSGTGTGSGTLTYKVLPNTGQARGGNISVGNAKFGVYQSDGCTYLLSNSSANLGYGGWSNSFSINTAAGCTWTAASSASWLSASPASGTGSAVINYVAAANTTQAIRTANLLVGGKTFTVTEQAAPVPVVAPVVPACSFTINPVAANLMPVAQTGSAAVTGTTGCAWNAKSDATWLTIAPGSGSTGSGTLRYSVTANTGPARTATLTLGGKTFPVTQSTGCAYTLSAASKSFASAGGPGSVNMTVGAGCSWTVTSNQSWLVPTTSYGVGNGTISFTVAPNAGTVARSAQLNIGGKLFTVSEAPPAPALAAYSTTVLTFAQTKLGSTSAPGTITLTNTGDLPLTLKSLNVGGSHSEFIRSGTCAANAVIPGKGTCTISYNFKPMVIGARSATLQVVTNANSVVLTVRGQGTK